MKLYFLRHGLAGERDEWKGSDNERPLTPEGIAKMQRTANFLAQLDLPIDAILTSPLVRARQTADIVAQMLKLENKLSEDKRLAPGFDDDKLHALLLDHPADAVMLVGHEPDFSDTMSALIGGGRINMKKGALALVELPNAHSKHGELVWLLPPKILAQE